MVQFLSLREDALPEGVATQKHLQPLLYSPSLLVELHRLMELHMCDVVGILCSCRIVPIVQGKTRQIQGSE